MYNGLIVWGKKVSKAFREKAIAICQNLDIDINWLMSCIAWETGETFSASIKNAAGSGAVGLIQFMDSTAKMLGTSILELCRMTAVEQLDYVEKYLLPYKGKLKSLEDVYMAILWPAAVGKPLSYVLASQGNKTYLQNRGLDINDDGKITKAEATAKVRNKFERGLLPEFCFVTQEYFSKTAELAEEIEKGIDNVGS